MSTQAMTWAIEQRTGSPSGKTVLWSIANYANQHWCAWPSQQIIVDESEQSPDSIQRRIPDLEALGLIRRIPLRFSGRKTVDFIILAPSVLFKASLAEIEPFLPRGCVVDPKWAALRVTANRGSVETGTSTEQEKPALPQTLPQPAADAAAMVRQHEPSIEPLEPLRENARAREGLTGEEAFATLATLWPSKDMLADARAVWDALPLEERLAAAAYAPRFVADLKSKGKRTVFEALPKYLKGAAWRFAGQEAKAREQSIELKPYSRRFWAWIWRKLADGQRVNFALSEAQHGKSTWVRSSELPSDEDERALVAVEVVSEAFAAWREGLAKEGVTLHRPDQVPVIWCPSEYPPATMSKVREKEGAAA